jgi:hypothetical protein
VATVTLGTLWLNLASDLSQSWSFPMLSSLQSSPTVNTTSRLYAGGNYRQVTTPGRQSSLAVTVSAATADDRQALEFDLVGVLLCVRDDRGRKFYGFYTNPQVAEHQFDAECEIALTFAEVTVSEAV